MKQLRRAQGLCPQDGNPVKAGYKQCERCLHNKRYKHRNNIRDRNVAYIQSAKDQPCKDCGKQFHHVAMDFDHIVGEKLYDVSDMIDMSLDLIKAEIAKCEVVCAVCHRIRTWERNQVALRFCA